MLSLLVNLFFAWWMWHLSKGHFEQGNNGFGWTCLVLSAANFATAMALIF